MCHLGLRGRAWRRLKLLNFNVEAEVLALYNAWEEPLASEPKGVCRHDDRRPMLGRKLKGKSQREMAMLGLTVPGPDSSPEGS